mgnify:CR=1 FL=1
MLQVLLKKLTRELVMLVPIGLSVLWMGVYPQPFTEVMHASVNDLLTRLNDSLATQKRIAIVTEVAPHAASAILDPRRFKQVLYNYLSNALKFTPDGGRVTVRTLGHGDDYFRLEVEDNGIGISEEDQKRLFIDFQQLESGSTKKHGGTGLGLALTKRLVEAQRGSVAVHSTPGKGCTFSSTLPRMAAVAVPGQSSAATSAAASSGRSPPA